MVSSVASAIRGIVRHDRPLVIALLIEVAIIVALMPLALMPRWQVRQWPVLTTLGYGSPSWSPSERYLSFEMAGTFSVLSSSGSLVLTDQPGWSPAWLDDDTIAALVKLDVRTSQLVKVDVPSGNRRTIGGPIDVGRLYADGHRHLAHWHVLDWVHSTVLDPDTGQVIAVLGGRPLLWTRHGSLVVKSPILLPTTAFPEAGYLSLWSPDDGTMRLARGYAELTSQPVLSPNGDAIACMCIELTARPVWANVVALAVPLDGSAPERVATSGPYGSQGPAWVDDRSMFVVDEQGVRRHWIDSERSPILVRPPRLPRGVFFNARVARLVAGTLVLAPESVPSATGTLRTTAWRLDVFDPRGMSLYSLPLTSVNIPVLSVGPYGRTVIILADPQQPGEPPTAAYWLDSP